MTRESLRGTCESCGRDFGYYLIDNGFNESAYAYCSSCGMTALLDTGYADRPGIPRHRSISQLGESLLAPCVCGGTFSASAAPRCPHCRSLLSAQAATAYIEANAPGTREGWRWQGTWNGNHALVVEDLVVSNPWRQS